MGIRMAQELRTHDLQIGCLDRYNFTLISFSFGNLGRAVAVAAKYIALKDVMTIDILLMRLLTMSRLEILPRYHMHNDSVICSLFLKYSEAIPVRNMICAPMN